MAPHSGQGQAETAAGGLLVAAHSPRLLFVALGDVGKVDLFELATGRRLASVSVPGISCLCDYWRQ